MEPITVYEAGRHRTVGLASMARDISRMRELIWRLFLRDFVARYRQSVLGYAWVLGPPLVTVVVFTFLTRSRVLTVEATALPYPAFVLLGMTVWGLFASGLTALTASLAGAANVIQRINFPREAVTFAAAGQAVFETLVRAVILVPAFLLLGAHVRWTTVFVPLLFVPLILLTLGAGFLLAVLNVVSRDVNTAVGLVLQLGIFVTPVVYPAPTTWPLAVMNLINPVSPIVASAHDLVSRGSLSMPLPLAVSCGISVLLFGAGWRVIRLAQPIIGERV